MHSDTSIFVAGHSGLVGSALVRKLQHDGYSNLVLRTRDQLDLREPSAVEKFFEIHHPDYVFLAAARVGGILANDTRPAEFIRDNLLIQTNVIHAAWQHGVRKLLFLGSSCIYPKHASQPILEDRLLTGALEPTNEAYAIAKIAGIKMAQSYRKQYGFDAINLMPTNLYGPGDNFDLTSGHVLPALIRKFHDAKMAGAGSVTIWGTGKPRREFLHVDDLAGAAVHLMQHYTSGEIVNVGTGEDISIGDLGSLVRNVVDWPCEIIYDTSKPDGTPRKLLDISRLSALGWKARIGLADGIQNTYEAFLNASATFARAS